MVVKKLINVRVTEEEARLLADYAASVGRSQTDVLREFIRSLQALLARRGRPSPSAPGGTR
jgi:hypothetical protein